MSLIIIIFYQRNCILFLIIYSNIQEKYFSNTNFIYVKHYYNKNMCFNLSNKIDFCFKSLVVFYKTKIQFDLKL